MMPLTVGSRAKPVIRRSRGRFARRPTQKQREAVTAMADLSEVGSAASNYSVPTQTAQPKKRKNRTMMMMEEMMEIVKKSEQRCMDKTKAVGKQLVELRTSNREAQPDPPTISTPRLERPKCSTDFCTDFDDDAYEWSGAPSPIRRHPTHPYRPIRFNIARWRQPDACRRQETSRQSAPDR